MTILRFQKAAGVTATDITRQLPAGTFTSVSVPEPGTMVDVNVTAGGVTDATAFMSGLGYTLFATDPVPTLENAAAAEVPPIDRMKLSDGTVLTVGAMANGQGMVRSGSNLVGAATTAFDIRDVLAFDHFVTGNLDLDELGIMGWRTDVAGTGADLVLATPESGHPGILDFGAGTVAGGRSAIRMGEAGLQSFLLSGSQNTIDQEWLVRFNANALSLLNLERFVVGWGDGFDAVAGTEIANGAYCEFDPSVSTNFRLVTASASVRTKTTASTIVASGVWIRIGLSVRYPGGVPTCDLLINGSVVATNTANFPAVGLGVGLRLDANATALEARVQADYMKMMQVTEKET